MYEIINEIIRNSYSGVDLVILKLKSNQKDYTVYPTDSLTPPPPPHPNDKAYYKKDLFESLYNKKMIDSIDIDYMYNQIDSLETYSLDSKKINRKSILSTNEEILKMAYGANDVFEVMNKMNAYSYIELSIPLISKDKNKMLFEIEEYCGSLCGTCYLLLFEKYENKWRIKYCYLKWIS